MFFLSCGTRRVVSYTCKVDNVRPPLHACRPAWRGGQQRKTQRETKKKGSACVWMRRMNRLIVAWAIMLRDILSSEIIHLSWDIRPCPFEGTKRFRGYWSNRGGLFGCMCLSSASTLCRDALHESPGAHLGATRSIPLVVEDIAEMDQVDEQIRWSKYIKEVQHSGPRITGVTIAKKKRF